MDPLYVVCLVVAALAGGFVVGWFSRPVSIKGKKRPSNAKRPNGGKRPPAGRKRPASRPASKGGSDAVELYVGNLPYETSEKELEKMFSKFGSVVSTRIISNRFNGRSKGYGFVEMDGDAAADKAASEMSGCELSGRKIVVNTAKSKAKDG